MIFLAEHYLPGSPLADLRRRAMRIRDAVAHMQAGGTSVRLLGSTIVPLDEAVLCVIEAPTEADVRLVSDHAEVSFERISAAMKGPASPRRHARPTNARLEELV